MNLKKKGNTKSHVSHSPTTSMSQSDTPNLIKIRRLDSNEIGDANLALTTITPTNKSIGGGGGDDGGTIGNKLSKKPPLDKEKRQQQQTLVSNKSPSTTTTTNPSQRPSMQGWLYKLKEPSLNASSISSSSSSSSLNTLNSDFNVHKSKKASKWKNYW